MHHTFVVVALLALAGQAVLAPGAMSADVSRTEYVAQSEPICKANTIASRGILQGTRQDIRNGKLKRAGGKFQRAARVLEVTIESLEGLERPSADVTILARWFERLNDEADLLDRVAKQLMVGKTARLGRYILEMRHTANQANNVVLTFGFEYCLLQPARYL